jgi:hypothetical protein
MVNDLNSYFLYEHICPNGWHYVGITNRKTLNTRWRGGIGYRKNYPFFNYIMRVGWQNILHICLESNLTEEQARTMERDLIHLRISENIPLYNVIHNNKK